MTSPTWISDCGTVKLWQADCRDVLPTLSGVDAVVTDPPYTAAGGSSNGRSSELDYQFFEHWLRDIAKMLRSAVKPTGCGFYFCDWRTLGVVERSLRSDGEWQSSSGQGWRVSQALVWDRDCIGMGSPFRNAFEMIAFQRGPSWKAGHISRNIGTVIRHRWFYGRHDNHQAEKPVGLCERLVGWTPKEGSILDPFMGSGSSGVAALRQGRRFLGIEIDNTHFETAKRRIQEELRRVEFADPKRADTQMELAIG